MKRQMSIEAFLIRDTDKTLRSRKRSEDETTLSSCDSAQKRLQCDPAFAESEETRPESADSPLKTQSEDEEMCVDWNVAWLRNERRTASLQWDYDKKLVHITVKMRSVLLDWLFEVMLEYKLSNKTLQLAALYVDRFLSRFVATPKSALQLLGVAALLVASKFEDVRPIEVASLIWISDEAYTADQLKGMEKALLETLCWDVASVPAVCWVETLVEQSGLQKVDAQLWLQFATYLSHLMVQHWQCSQWLLPSQQAAAALFYAGLCQGLFSAWPTKLLAPLYEKEEDNRLDEHVLRCLRALHQLLKSMPHPELHRALRSKYSHFSLNSVALTPPLSNLPF